METFLQAFGGCIYNAKLIAGFIFGDMYWHIISMHFLLPDKLERRAYLTLKSFFIGVCIMLLILPHIEPAVIGTRFTIYVLIIYYLETKFFDEKF